MYYVYVLKSQIYNKIYIGFSEDLKSRFIAHQKGLVRTTKNWQPLKLVYYEAYASKKDAIIREKRLKQFKRAYSEIKKRATNSIMS